MQKTRFLRFLVADASSTRGMSPLLLAFLCALYLLAFANFSLWQGGVEALSQGANSIGGLLVLALALLLLYVGIIYLLLWRGIGKLLLIIMFFCAAFAAYSMDAYGTHIDANMVDNLLETNSRELGGLMSWDLLLYVLLLGVLPASLVLFAPLRYPAFWKQLLLKPVVFGLCVLLAAGAIYSDYQQMSSFGRTHRPLRYLINPWMPLYYTYADFRDAIQPVMPFKVIGKGAHIGTALATAAKPTLVFLVVGESARAQEFSLDGYQRDTNPELSKLPLFSFRHVKSCGTETAVSVPCMFSPYPRHDYTKEKALHTSNVLDILKRAGVTLLWRDNNSGSKGMADRIAYQDVSSSKDPTDCAKGHDHCYDSVLLHGLPAWIQQQQGKKLLLVVLHMYGSHGPAYYKRYPASFRYFKPICKSNEFAKCTPQSIVNSYDNTIVYTDHVLATMIGFLKQQTGYNTAMLYLSDHGESLGEDGIYLHGMPRSIAPIEQIHIPFIWWMSEGYAKVGGVSATCLKQRLDEPLSQDYLFSSLLGMFDVKTQVYDQRLDFLAPCRG